MQLEEIESLNLEDLDIQELEARLEMATLETEAAPWICGTHDNQCSPVCGTQCQPDIGGTTTTTT